MQQTLGKQCKYIFICGAIASGIGKGVTNSSIGMLLKKYGYNVSFLKIDPYLNIDAGLMNPYEHGEVFVTSDGGEVDLDLGNYERFIGMNLTFEHSLTTGKLFQSILKKERAGHYLGRTVQIIPHVVNEIKSWVKNTSKIIVDDENDCPPDVLLVEVGGTVGDLESTYYYEAVRQMFMEEGHDNMALIMLTYILTLEGEQKTKPAQNGLKDLRVTGLQADFLVCRSQKSLSQNAKAKLALQGSMKPENVFSVPDVSHMFNVPQILEEQGFVQRVLDKLKLPCKQKPNLEILSKFTQWCEELKQQDPIKIGLFGKYMANRDTYMSLFKALQEAAYECEINLDIIPVDLLQYENDVDNKVEGLEKIADSVQGILVPGGFGDRGFEEKVTMCRIARETRKPFLGICYGFQAAIIEYARYLGYKDAKTEENQPDSTWSQVDDPNYFVIYMPEIDTKTKGGNMRLGARVSTILEENSLAFKIYGQGKITERHRHRFEVNPKNISTIEQGGGIFSGRDGNRMEIFELPENVHPFYVGVQYHPEFTSKCFKPNPLFVYFLKAVQNKKPQGVLKLERKWFHG